MYRMKQTKGQEVFDFGLFPASPQSPALLRGMVNCLFASGWKIKDFLLAFSLFFFFAKGFIVE